MQLVLLPADKHTQTQREINIPPTSSVISLCHEYTHTSYEHSCILMMFVLCVCIKCSTHPNTKNTNLPVEVMRCDVLVPPTDTLSLPSSWNTIVVCMFMHCLVDMQLCLVLLWKESVWNKNHPFLFSFPVIYCGYLELCFVSASVQCFFSPRFVHSFFHV